MKATVVNLSAMPHKIPKCSPSILAYKAVADAIKKGKLPALNGKIPCKDCGKPAAHYHHTDYLKPLDVDPLCAGCNSKRPPAAHGKVDMRKQRPSAWKDLVRKVGALEKGKVLKIKIPEGMRPVSARIGISWASRKLGLPVKVTINGDNMFLQKQIPSLYKKRCWI